MIRDYIQQEISDMFEDPKTLVDIKDFQTRLITEFTTRSLVKTFRNKEVQSPRKQTNVNNTGVTENNKKEHKQEVLDYIKEWEKERVPARKDWENAKELAEEFIKLCNESKKDVSLFKNKAVSDLCKEKQMRICGSCLSTNCLKK